jgi:hypothetical protein
VHDVVQIVAFQRIESAVATACHAHDVVLNGASSVRFDGVPAPVDALIGKKGIAIWREVDAQFCSIRRQP